MQPVSFRYPAALVGATACMGTMAALIAHVPAHALAAGSVVNLAGGLVLLALAARQGSRSTAPLWAWPALAALEAGNAGSYFLALKLAPTAPVVALHLMSPVILLAAGLIAVRARPRATDLCTFVLLGCAVAFAAAQGADAGGTGDTVIGLGLALMSACCLAGLITVVKHVADGADPLLGGGVQLTGAGLALAPSLIWLTPTAEPLMALSAIGALLMAPAFYLIWVGTRHVPAATVATLGLSEPFFSGLVAAVVFGTAVTGLQAGAVLCALGAAYLQVPRPRTTR